jgi:hypothetical protein
MPKVFEITEAELRKIVSISYNHAIQCEYEQEGKTHDEKAEILKASIDNTLIRLKAILNI